LEQIEIAAANFAGFMWGTPLVFLLVGGGLFFMIHSRLLQYRYIGHSLDLLRGKYHETANVAVGGVSHWGALATALSGTIGLGNITGVAVAITLGGPGAIFWMWITAIVGTSTKFYTASLAIMYRGHDDKGDLQGGPMYVIREGLGKKWMPLAIMFAFAGLLGTSPIFQVNQLVQILRDVIAVPAGIATSDNHFSFDLVMGLLLACLVYSVIAGKIKRISSVAGKVVPFMVVFYILITAYLLIINASAIPTMLALIFTDAFTGDAVSGGVIGAVILIGVQRGVFSNEAGIGTESLAHGAAKTNEPIREGLVAMVGPVIDTLIVCTCTALALLVTGAWEGDAVGVSMTSAAYEQAFPGVGSYLVLGMVFAMSTTTVLTYWYYGSKCMAFLFGTAMQKYYTVGYMILIALGAVASLEVVISLFDGAYATMAIPTMVSTILLAPKVREKAKDYFKRLNAGEFESQKSVESQGAVE
jgi:AGCS family alanine or glycine:cation symporter